MTTTLIVLAHPGRTSFNRAWAQATEKAALALGDEVLWSDLNAMGFDPVERPGQYGASRETAFDPLKRQEAAALSGDLPGDVAGEIAKVRAADRIVFHFPLWWFAPPAILKGWCDRVLAHGALHNVDERFDTGMCRGKAALFCVTTGSRASESAFNGREGDVTMLLWPLAYALRYLGFAVLEPVTAHGVHGYHKGARRAELEARLGAVLDAQGALMAGFDARPVMQFNADSDFDAAGRLKPGAAQYSYFIRQKS